jgi:predicted porin
MKKVLSLAIAAALVAPAAAMADATLFGKVHMIAQDVDDGSDDVWSVDSVASRVGVKGSEDLGDGLTAVYHLEFGVNIDDSSTVSNRNQFVGLAGGFGTFLAGRHDTPMKMSQGKFDEFGDLPYGDIEDVIPGDDRLSNVMAYVSPAMGGLTFVGATVAGELGDTGDAATSDLTSLMDHFSLAALYSNGPIFASLSYNGYDTGALLPDSYSPSIVRATFIWNGGNWQVGGIFADTSTDDLLNLDDSTAYGLSGHFMVSGNDKIKAQWLNGDSEPIGAGAVGLSPNVNISGGDDEVTQWSIGYEHSFSKRTYMHAGYTNNELDSRNDDESAIFAGLVHSF